MRQNQIVDQLRKWASAICTVRNDEVPGSKARMAREAADEIERLRLESAIPRDEYAATWKALLDQIEDLDIVDWIRAYAKAYHPSDYVSPIAREVIARSDKKWLQAADEIERLTAERDEARREICDRVSTTRFYPHYPLMTKRQYAQERGWDCFKEEV